MIKTNELKTHQSLQIFYRNGLIRKFEKVLKWYTDHFLQLVLY